MRLALLLLTCLLFTSCTSKSGPVTVACAGTVLKDGRPLDVANRDIGVGMVSIEFIPIETPTPTTERYGTTVDKAGNFSIPGGIPPGKYKITVRQWDPYPETDKLASAFAEDQTPLVRTVDGTNSLAIDLSQP